MAKKIDGVVIVFNNITKDRMVHIENARKELKKAGVTFDSGWIIGIKKKCESIEWEMDWSLEGAKVVPKKFRECLYKKKDKNKEGK